MKIMLAAAVTALACLSTPTVSTQEPVWDANNVVLQSEKLGDGACECVED